MKTIKAKPLENYAFEIDLTEYQSYYVSFPIQEPLTIEGFQFTCEQEQDKSLQSRLIDRAEGFYWETLCTRFSVGRRRILADQDTTPYFGVPIAFLEKFRSMAIEAGLVVNLSFFNRSSSTPERKIKAVPIGFTFAEWREAQRGDHMEPHLCRFCESSPCMCEQD